MARDNYTFLTTAPERKVILALAGPAIVSMLATSLHNMVSTFYVGRISTQATAAVGVSFALMSVIQAIGFLFGQGSGNFISRALGARKKEQAERMAATGFIWSAGSGLLLAALGLIFMEPLCVLLGSTPTILPETKRYLLWVLLGMPVMTGTMTLNNQLRFQGSARFAMYGVLAGAAVNVALSPVFIFTLRLGVTGAGMGVFCGQAVSLAVMLWGTSRAGNIRIRPRLFSTDGFYLREMMAGGTPSLTRQGLASVSVALLNVAAGAYGDAAIAGMSIVGRITFVIMSAVIGLGHGYQPLCGFSYGAGLYGRVKRGYWFVVRVGMIFLAVCSVLGIAFAEPLIRLFRNDPAVVEAGSVALIWQMYTLPLGAFIMYTNMMMQTTRKPVEANILAAARNGIFFIPLILLLPRRFGLLGVQMCQTWADVLSFILAVAIAIRGFRGLSEKE